MLARLDNVLVSVVVVSKEQNDQKNSCFDGDLFPFQASGPQKKAWRRLPSQLPPRQGRSSPGLQEDVRPPAERGAVGPRALQPALPLGEASTPAGSALPSGSEVAPRLPLSTGAPPRGGRRRRCYERPRVEQQENMRRRPGD